MEISHVLVYVKDRPKAVEWLRTIWVTKPVAEDHEMSMFVFDSTQLIINDVEEDILSTIAFSSDNCDEDYKKVISKGAISIQVPEDKPWGVRIAFVQGPGKLIFEIEQKIQR